MKNTHKEKIISQLNGRTQMDAFEAAKAIWADPDKLEPALIRTLKKGRRPFNRAAAAYAMQMLQTSRAIVALEKTTSNKSENPRVRGEAAEALAHGHRRKSREVLLKGLSDSSKDVRFWCAFALSQNERTVTITPAVSPSSPATA